MVDDDSSMFFAVPLSCKASSQRLWPACVRLPRVHGVGEKFVDTALAVRESDHSCSTVNGTMVLNMCSAIEKETMRRITLPNGTQYRRQLSYTFIFGHGARVLVQRQRHTLTH